MIRTMHLSQRPAAAAAAHDCHDRSLQVNRYSDAGHADTMMSVMSMCARSCNQRRRGIRRRPGPARPNLCQKFPGPARPDRAGPGRADGPPGPCRALEGASLKCGLEMHAIARSSSLFAMYFIFCTYVCFQSGNKMKHPCI